MTNNGNGWKIPYEPNKPFWKSKKVLAMFFGVAIALINQVTGQAIDPNALWVVIAPIIGYILGQAAVDANH